METGQEWSSIDHHLEDLRKTLLSTLLIVAGGFVIIFFFYQPILNFLIKENSFLFVSNNRPVQNLLILGPLDGISLVCKMSFWLSLFLTSPLWGWKWLQFILPGMLPGEKQLFMPFIFLSGCFIFLGLCFAFVFTFPASIYYLTYFNATIGQNAWTLANYIDFSFVLYAGHAIAAEFALIFLILVHFNILSTEWLISKRRLMIILAFVLGAFLTPPDILTQVMLAIPMIGLYEMAIIYSKWKLNKNKQAILHEHE